MQIIATNFGLSKIPFEHFQQGSRPTLTPRIRHVHLPFLIRERLQTPTTTTTTTTTTPDAKVQSLGRHIANEKNHRIRKATYLCHSIVKRTYLQTCIYTLNQKKIKYRVFTRMNKIHYQWHNSDFRKEGAPLLLSFPSPPLYPIPSKAGTSIQLEAWERYELSQWVRVESSH